MILAPLAFAASLAAFHLPAGADTTLIVPKGVQLNVADYAGEVFIQTWSQNAVRILADYSDEDRVIVEPSENVLLVKAYSKEMADRTADIRLTVPTWMDLDVSGIHTDVIITGTEGAVKVETVHGDVIVQGGRKRIRLNTVNDDIALSGADGAVHAETVNGSAYVYRVRSDSVDVSTVNGGICYEGTIGDKGCYRFTSHNGDVAVAVPRAANAAVAISTFSGEFESSFPVTLSETKAGRRFQFCLGTCSGRVELGSFQGTIHLYRPDATPSNEIRRIEGIVSRIIAKRLDPAVERRIKLERKTKDNPKEGAEWNWVGGFGDESGKDKEKDEDDDK